MVFTVNEPTASKEKIYMINILLATSLTWLDQYFSVQGNIACRTSAHTRPHKTNYVATIVVKTVETIK